MFLKLHPYITFTNSMPAQSVLGDKSRFMGCNWLSASCNYFLLNE